MRRSVTAPAHDRLYRIRRCQGVELSRPWLPRMTIPNRDSRTCGLT